MAEFNKVVPSFEIALVRKMRKELSSEELGRAAIAAFEAGKSGLAFNLTGSDPVGYRVDRFVNRPMDGNVYIRSISSDSGCRFTRELAGSVEAAALARYLLTAGSFAVYQEVQDPNDAAKVAYQRVHGSTVGLSAEDAEEYVNDPGFRVVHESECPRMGDGGFVPWL